MNNKRPLVLNADQLRKGKGESFGFVQDKRGKGKVKKQEIYIVLDNVLDTYNIGSIFRLADAVAAKKIYICGESETPPNHRIKKASINTMEWVEWEYCESALEAVHKLKVNPSASLGTRSKKLKVIAIEQSAKSVPYDKFEYKMPVCLVVGHESDGVSPEVLKIADAVVELPMFGVNTSLNVVVSLGIVLYKVIEKTEY